MGGSSMGGGQVSQNWKPKRRVRSVKRREMFPSKNEMESHAAQDAQGSFVYCQDPPPENLLWRVAIQAQ